MSAGGHRGFVAALPPERRKALLARSDGPGLRRIGLHCGAILSLGAAIAAGVPGWPVLMLPQGVLIVFLFTAMHESIHRTAFSTERLNDAVAGAAGVVLFLPPEWFRLFHFAHHRHTQDPDRDPELASEKPGTWPAFLWHLSGLPHWMNMLRNLARNAAGRNADSFVPEAARARVAFEARAMVFGYAGLAAASLAAGSAMLVWVWLLPMLLGQPALRLYLLAEHGRCPRVADMFSNSRTTLSNRALRWLAWNMPFHAEHHAMPSVPFHRLPELHRLAEAELKVTAPGYARFAADYAAGLGRTQA